MSYLIAYVNGVPLPAQTISYTEQFQQYTASGTVTLQYTQGGPFPSEFDEVIIKDESGTPVFGGYIATLSLDDEQKSYATQVKVTLALRNYRILTDTAALLTKSYTIQADNAIIVDAFATSALADITVDIANLVNISTLTASFSNNTLTEVMDQICSATGGAWFIDASKVLHYVNPVY